VAVELDDRTPADRRRFTVPRGLVMLAALWTFASWTILFGLSPPVQAQAASYGPSITLLFTSVGVGLGVGWPLLRLTQQASAAPIRQSLADAAALVFLLQVVVWPLRLVTAWSMDRTLAVVAVFAIAASTIGAALAIAGRASSGRGRAAAMLVLVGATLAPTPLVLPDADAAAGPRVVGEIAVSLSPAALLARFSAPEPLGLGAADLSLLRTAAAVSGALWLCAFGVAFGVALAGRRTSPRDRPRETV
jgi:hypothetical protein